MRARYWINMLVILPGIILARSAAAVYGPQWNAVATVLTIVFIVSMIWGWIMRILD